MAANTMMALASGTQAISSAGSAYAQSQATKAQAIYQKQQYQTNAELADLQSADALNRGAKNASNIEKSVKQTVGAQRVDAAAQGLDPNTDTAASLESGTETLGALDALEAKNNAWKESFGYQMQASNATGEGNMAQLAGNNASRNTLITGGLQFFSHAAEAGYYGAGNGMRSKT